jgi:hypothetical protein
MIEAVHARVPIDVVLGIDRAPRDDAQPGDAADARYDRAMLTIPDPLDVSRLAAALSDPATGVIRAKGVLADRGGSVRNLQTIGARAAVTSAAEASRLRGLVCIGLKGRLDHAMIERAVADAGRIGP